MLDIIARETGCSIASYAPPSIPPLVRWARSGLMALTGPQDAAPLLAGRDYCGRIDELIYGVRSFAQAAGMTIEVDRDVITERAAMLRLVRGGTRSANRMCRMVRAQDGWIAVNLPRASDLELLPAWIGAAGAGNYWCEIGARARDVMAAKLVEDAQLLGLAVGRLGDNHDASLTMKRIGAPARRSDRPPLVLDLSTLWAGPLCGAILADAGADVIKLESVSRPDGARSGAPAFFARLNGKKRSVLLDLPRQRDILGKLLAVADVAIESARPRALAQWGFSLDEIFSGNTNLTWVSITAYGRNGPRNNWVGFGDDVAAAAGLVVESKGKPMFIGDAIADPLAGLAAAASCFASLAAGGGFLIDASLFAAAGFIAAAPLIEETAMVEADSGTWRMRAGSHIEPMHTGTARPVAVEARPLGADTASVLREVLS